jgi:hypothetical protein
MKKKDTQKITSEKPVSLSPLNFKEALLALLKTRPEPKEKKPKKQKKTGG